MMHATDAAAAAVAVHDAVDAAAAMQCNAELGAGAVASREYYQGRRRGLKSVLSMQQHMYHLQPRQRLPHAGCRKQ